MTGWALIFQILSNYMILLIHQEALVPWAWFPGDALQGGILCHATLAWLHMEVPPPLLLSLAGTFQRTNLFRVPCVLGLVVNHQWTASSVFLYLKQPWTLINAVAQQCLRHRGTSKALLVQEVALSCCSPPFPLNHSLPGLAWSWADWLAELQAGCGADESLGEVWLSALERWHTSQSWSSQPPGCSI